MQTLKQFFDAILGNNLNRRNPMTKHDIWDYIGVLIICAIVIFGMFQVQRHVDSLASTYNAQKHGKTDSRRLQMQEPVTTKKGKK